jgi:hypothetical protein
MIMGPFSFGDVHLEQLHLSLLSKEHDVTSNIFKVILYCLISNTWDSIHSKEDLPSFGCDSGASIGPIDDAGYDTLSIGHEHIISL